MSQVMGERTGRAKDLLEVEVGFVSATCEVSFVEYLGEAGAKGWGSLRCARTGWSVINGFLAVKLS